MRLVSTIAIFAAPILGFPSASQFSHLNGSVHGRLHRGTPLSLPCFSSYNNHSVTPDRAACAVVQANYTTPALRAAHYGAYMFPQWETCFAEQDNQCLLDYADRTDPKAFVGVSCEQGSVSPYYIDVRTPGDVSAAFAFAERTGVHLVIKNSGHDYKGRSTGSREGSLGLWMQNLKNITHDPAFVPEGCSKANGSYNSITTAAGVSFVEAYTYADEHNITMIGGYHQTIGTSGGWVQGGGHSILSPVYGLGIDRVLEYKVVTPDGVLRTANQCQNGDLFWALRGGGGGTFGVVLAATHRAEPRLRLAVAAISFPQAGNNTAPWLRLLVDHALPWAAEGWGGHMTATSLINVNPRLPLAAAAASTQALADYARAQNGSAVLEELPSWRAFFDKYVLAAEAPVGSEQLLSARLIPRAAFEAPARRAQLRRFMDGIVAAGNSPYIVVGAPVLFPYPEGSTSATPAWRTAVWEMGGAHGEWAWNATVAQKTAKINAVRADAQRLRDILPGSGAYTNEGDLYEPDPAEAFWGVNYERLLKIKRRYDPHGLLDCWQCVGWSGANSSRYACYIKP